MKQDDLKKRISWVVMGLFILLATISLIMLIGEICRRVIEVNLSKAICYVNDDKIELNIKNTKSLENNEYEVTLKDGSKWIVNERHCQLVRE